jgi:outer membrane receptor protein involved in Fe transport
LYGTNAFFAIVNIVTRAADESPRAWGRVAGTQFAGGSFAAGFAAGDVGKQLRATVAGLHRGGETLDVPDEIAGEPVDADRMRGLNASLVGAWGGGFAQARYFRRERMLPFAPYLTYVDERNQNTDEQLLLEGGYTRALRPDLSVTARGYASRYRFTDYLVYEPDDDNFQDFGDADWIGAELRGRWDLLDRGRLGVTAGGEASWNRTESRSHYEGMAGTPDAVVIPIDFSIQGLYAEVDGQPRPWLGFTAGLRYDRHSLLENEVSPRAALFLDRDDDVGLKLLYAHGFRNPTPYEGFFEDGISFEANPEIGAETIDSYEIVLWGRPRSGLSTRLSGFRWEADRIVEQAEGPGGLLQFQNLGALTSTGVEVEASYRDARGWLGFVGATWSRVEGTGGAEVPGAPALVATAGGSTPLIAELIHVSTDLQLVGPRPTRDPAVEADAFVGWNAAVYLPDLRGLDITVGVRNLIGRRERVPAQEDYDREDVIVPVLPGEGRELHARVGYRFD